MHFLLIYCHKPPQKETEIDFLWALRVFPSFNREMHKCNQVTPSLVVIAAVFWMPIIGFALGDPSSDLEGPSGNLANILSNTISCLFYKSKNCCSEFKMNNYYLHMCKIGFLWHPYFSPDQRRLQCTEKNHIFDFFFSWINYMLTSSDRIQM